MFRRLVCLLLVPALLGYQAVMVCAHVHSGSEPAGQTARKHVHTSDHNHDHGFHHGDAEHGNHSHSPEQPPNGTPIVFADGPINHDSDAVFLGEQSEYQIQSGKTAANAATAILICFVSETLQLAKPGFCLAAVDARPTLPHQCAIYLQTSRLLI